ncbi:cysteine hydrolase family protein [Pokkaliibacter sp. MBI-7]|uniref:cysteine hydrolase family protein n=1 Tax=Pokkaliibacter sp. MBI-7 TaxID=3040600 RepID=UPI00244ABA94|nr:cysteine hydrolase family protein [Pokkaliibacter sp. MBI-7]MDH2432336.1 cysteine hydrolase family protein [Pokkaliibacter sp. MBI-7]
MSHPALIVIDVQQDYFAGGLMPLENPDAAVQQINRLLAHFRAQGWPAIQIQHEMLSRPGRPAAFFIPGSPGMALHPDMQPEAGEALFIKHLPNSFAGTELHGYLQQQEVRELVVVGMMTHMCVDSTSRAALDLGYSVRIALDATACPALSFADQQIPAAQVKTTVAAALHGTFAQVMSTDELLQQLN